MSIQYCQWIIFIWIAFIIILLLQACGLGVSLFNDNCISLSCSRMSIPVSLSKVLHLSLYFCMTFPWQFGSVEFVLVCIILFVFVIVNQIVSKLWLAHKLSHAHKLISLPGFCFVFLFSLCAIRCLAFVVRSVSLKWLCTTLVCFVVFPTYP